MAIFAVAGRFKPETATAAAAGRFFGAAESCREAGLLAAIFAVAGRFKPGAVTTAAAGRFFGAMRRGAGCGLPQCEAEAATLIYGAFDTFAPVD